MRGDGKRGGSTKEKWWMEKQVGERISEEKKIVHIYIYIKVSIELVEEIRG